MENLTPKEWPCAVCGKNVLDPKWWMRTTLCEKHKGDNEVISSPLLDELESGPWPQLLEAMKKCRWRLTDGDESTWSTDCGEDWTFIGGGPYDSNMKFCPFCGKPLAESKEE